jgi:hypothetical protein
MDKAAPLRETPAATAGRRREPKGDGICGLSTLTIGGLGEAATKPLVSCRVNPKAARKGRVPDRRQDKLIVTFIHRLSSSISVRQ